MSDLTIIARVSGRPIPLRGNDVDTDRIIPARFMKAVTFDGLGELAFRDERHDESGNQKDHPMNDPRFRAKGTRIAVVNQNFGCGSSREHAPQALLRWGIKCLVGESFADIFFGNCVALGIPCMTAPAATIESLMNAVEEDTAHDMVVDIDRSIVEYRGTDYPGELPAGVRQQLLEGTWDATRVLMSAAAEVKRTAAALPYIAGFGK